jgi:hypothetical protein
MDRETLRHQQERQMLESLRFSVSSRAESLAIGRLAHDLTAAATAFILMVEEAEHQLGTSPDLKQQLKLQQLRDHANRNQLIITKIAEALRQKDPSGGAP